MLVHEVLYNVHVHVDSNRNKYCIQEESKLLAYFLHDGCKADL